MKLKLLGHKANNTLIFSIFLMIGYHSLQVIICTSFSTSSFIFLAVAQAKHFIHSKIFNITSPKPDWNLPSTSLLLRTRGTDMKVA